MTLPPADSPHAQQCSACLPGTFNNFTSQTSCQACPTSTYSNVQKSLKCQACGIGQFQNLAGQTSCRSCPAGTFYDPTSTFNSATGFCAACPAGTYSGTRVPHLSIDTLAIVAMSIRFFQQHESIFGSSICNVAISFLHESCDNCLLISLHMSPCIVVCSDTNGALSCIPCAPGFSTNGGTGKDECLQCAPGLFADVNGTATCKACPSTSGAVWSEIEGGGQSWPRTNGEYLES